MNDPFAVLGLAPTASVEEVRLARRDLAKRHHPDTGGDPETMRTINQAAGQALQAIAARTTAPTNTTNTTDTADAEEPTGVSRDVPSFTVEALPVETFEAMLIVAGWIGEVLDDDPPYRLDVHLHEPVPCWCRLELVPDAGASTVSITLAGESGRPIPDIESVRDVWVDQLNRYDWR